MPRCFISASLAQLISNVLLGDRETSIRTWYVGVSLLAGDPHA